MLPADPALKSLVAFLANPMIVMLAALLVAVFTLGVARGQKLSMLMAGRRMPCAISRPSCW
jgi:Gnt-I system high-affinity gluconate transporter